MMAKMPHKCSNAVTEIMLVFTLSWPLVTYLKGKSPWGVIPLAKLVAELAIICCNQASKSLLAWKSLLARAYCCGNCGVMAGVLFNSHVLKSVDMIRAVDMAGVFTYWFWFWPPKAADVIAGICGTVVTEPGCSCSTLSICTSLLTVDVTCFWLLLFGPDAIAHADFCLVVIIVGDGILLRCRVATRLSPPALPTRS